jgi:hypothetical protein
VVELLGAGAVGAFDSAIEAGGPHLGRGSVTQFAGCPTSRGFRDVGLPTAGTPPHRVPCDFCGIPVLHMTGILLAQRRGPQRARFWLAGVEGFSAAFKLPIVYAASAAEGRVPHVSCISRRWERSMFCLRQRGDATKTKGGQNARPNKLRTAN